MIIDYDTDAKYAIKNVTEDEIVKFCYTLEEAEEEIEGLVDLDRFDGIYNEYTIINL